MMTTSRSPIGIDFGSGGVRAVQLRRNRKTLDWKIVAASRREDLADASGDPPSWSALKECLSDGPFQGRRVVCGLDSPVVEYCAVELPATILNGDADDAAKAIQFEMERVMTNPVDTVQMRHWRLSQCGAAAPNVMGAVGLQSALELILATCSESGLSCVQIDASALALSRLGCVIANPALDQVWGVLDLGLSSSRMVVCLGETPVLSRRVGEGGQELTRKIARQLHVSECAAETLKREYGCASQPSRVRGGDHVGAEPAAPLEGKNPLEDSAASIPAARHGYQEIASILHGALRMELHNLAAEIKRSFEYVLGCYPGKELKEMILIGGGAGMPGLAEYFQGGLGIKTIRARDVVGRADGRIHVAPEWAEGFDGLGLALGLALDAETVA